MQASLKENGIGTVARTAADGGRYIASQADRHVNRHTGDDALAPPVHYPRAYSTGPTGAVVTRSTTTRAITHRVELELLGFFPLG